MEQNASQSAPESAKKTWEKPVVEDVSLESKEDVLGACFSPSASTNQPVCGPSTQCLI